MLSSKQRAALRAMAATADTILIVGKGGVTETVVAQAADALKARELIKGKVLESALLSPREVCDALCAACRAEPVQCIGSKFVIYNRNERDPKITLPSAKKKKA